MTPRSATCGSLPNQIPLEDGSSTLLPVLVITAAHSRFMVGRMIPTRTTADLLLGMWMLLQLLGRVPRRLIWDNETGIVSDWLSGDQRELERSLRGFVGAGGYDVASLRRDLDRFVFLLGGSDGGLLFGVDGRAEPQRGCLGDR